MRVGTRHALLSQPPSPLATLADEDEQFKEEKAVIIKEISMLSSDSGPSGAGPPMCASPKPPEGGQQPQPQLQQGGV